MRKRKSYVVTRYKLDEQIISCMSIKYINIENLIKVRRMIGIMLSRHSQHIDGYSFIDLTVKAIATNHLKITKSDKVMEFNLQLDLINCPR